MNTLFREGGRSQFRPKSRFYNFVMPLIRKFSCQYSSQQFPRKWVVEVPIFFPEGKI